jgi:hypothetical protein
MFCTPFIPGVILGSTGTFPDNDNKYKGNMWGDVRIVLENDNSLRAKAYLWNSTALDQSTGEDILDQEFTKSIELDTEYTVSMELSGSQLNFRYDDEEFFFQIQTPVSAPYEPYHHLCTRIYPEPGSAISVKAFFDDLKLEKSVIGDFDSDCDVDGSDLAIYISNHMGISLESLASNFGKVKM